jgi:Siphovirus Gp157
MKLFEISQQFKELELLTDSAELPAEVINDTLEALGGDFDMKAEAVAKFILSLEASADASAEAAKAMAARSARYSKRADSIRAYLLFHCQALQRRKIETDEIVIKIAKNPPMVYVTDETTIPDEYWEAPEPAPRRLNKKALKQAIESGIRIDGAYVEAGERLNISL